MQLPRKVAAAVELYSLTEKGHNIKDIAKASDVCYETSKLAIRILQQAKVVTIGYGKANGIRRAWNAPKDKSELPSLLGYSNTPYFWNAVRQSNIKTFPEMLKIKRVKKKSNDYGPKLEQTKRLAQCGHPSIHRYFKCEKCQPVLKSEDAYAESY